MTPIEELLASFESSVNPVTRSSLRGIIVDRLFKIYHRIKLTHSHFVLVEGFHNIEQATIFLCWMKQYGIREFSTWLDTNYTTPEISNRPPFFKETDHGHTITLRIKEE